MYFKYFPNDSYAGVWSLSEMVFAMALFLQKLESWRNVLWNFLVDLLLSISTTQRKTQSEKLIWKLMMMDIKSYCNSATNSLCCLWKIWFWTKLEVLAIKFNKIVCLTQMCQVYGWKMEVKTARCQLTSSYTDQTGRASTVSQSWHLFYF